MAGSGGPAVGDAPAPPPPSELSSKAIASLTCGIFFIFPPFAIAAIILGHLSLSQIRKSGGRFAGNGLAIAGLVLGYLGAGPFLLIFAAIAIPNLLRARIAANESSAVAAVRTMNMAELVYSQKHPVAGYTCMLTDLHPSIDPELLNGRKHGYVFDLKSCSAETAGGPKVRYQLIAYPAVSNQTGVRAFCSDESGVIRADDSGTGQRCAENGRPLQ